MNFNDYRDIAKRVLKLANELDARILMPPDSAAQKSKIDTWATILAGHSWPAEAEAAVINHYRRPNAFPIMPGDVIAYCETQPVWSSIEHARDWIMRIGVQAPYSGAIEAYSGVQEPIIEIPPQIAREAHKAYLTQKLTEWAAPRLNEIAHAIVTRKTTPWWTA